MRAMIAAACVCWGMMQWGIPFAKADYLGRAEVIHLQLSPESTGRHYGYVLLMVREGRYGRGSWVSGVYSSVIIRKRHTSALPALSTGQADKLLSLLATQLAPRRVSDDDHLQRDRLIYYDFSNVTPSGAATYDYWYTKNSWVGAEVPYLDEDGDELRWGPVYDYP